MTFGFGVGIQRLGSVSVTTLAALSAITPGAGQRPMGFVVADGTPANNGVYTWTGSAWVRQRGLPDGLGSYTSVGGTANAITATLASGVDPAQIRGAILVPASSNTGAVTLNGEAIKSRGGTALSAGALVAGVAALLMRDGSAWRLMTGAVSEISDIAGLQAALDAKIAATALDTDSALAANSDAKIASQKAVKSYIDAAVSTILGGVSSAYDTLSEIATAITGILANGWVSTVRIADKAVTYAKLQDVSATGRVLGRKSAGAGVAEELTTSDVLDLGGAATRGDILYRGASAWLRLGKGAAGAVLTQGIDDPAWVAPNSKPAIPFFPVDNEPPSTNYATFGVRNGHPFLAFDTATQWTAIFSGVLPANYGGNGLTVSVNVMMETATTGTVGFDVAFERIDPLSLDLDADSFASAKTITATTVPSVSGQIRTLSVAFANNEIDGLLAGENFRLRLRRDVANDDAAGNAQVISVVVRET